MANKIDSNITGLRYAEETSTLKTLPGSPVWYPLEPNSYSDFGGQLKTLARNPINASRQRKKGTITDLDASGGFNQDLTQNNLTRLMQGVMFADARERTNLPMNGSTTIPVTAVATAADTYTLDNDPAIFLANHLVWASGFTNSGNNGLKLLSAASGTTVTSSTNLTDEASPPATAKLEAVGYQFASGTLDVTIVNSLPRLNRATGVFDLTTLGLIPGEWIYIGGDTAPTTFVNTKNKGFARVKSVAAGYIELDKTSVAFEAETGTGLTVQIFFGTVIKNETTAKRRTYHIERSLGTDANGTMYEYLVGACPNELTINVSQAEKITVDLSFVAVDNAQYTGAQSAANAHPGAAGTRPTLVNADCFNTSSDFSRIKLSTVPASTSPNPAPSPLFAYATELKLTVNNKVTPNKAIGTLGAFDTTAGTFEVGGNLTAYFADITAVQAVRNNSDITLDICIAKANAGIVFDIPLMSLGDGRLNVAMDEAITLPLEMNAAESAFGHTLLMNFFAYLPTVAEG